MATWYNSTAGTNPYMKLYAMPDPQDPSVYGQVAGIEQNYYMTMVSRLHNFDGSMVVPARLYYIEYTSMPYGGSTVPVITNAALMNYTEATTAAETFNAHAGTGYRAETFSPTIFLPKEPIPALKHYRLVHESPTNVIQEKTLDIKYVKTFEYVKGAHIKGSGIIEVPLITNTGREFVYRQESESGEFIVPYSTTGGSTEGESNR
jgi:dolichyl-diphosphooligosaccharide--protein glycosyltransferase